jgi:trehalose 6-phosphate phosphatase
LSLEILLESECTLSPESEEKLDQFFRAFSRHETPLLLLDYDGTLAGFRVNRFEAVPWAGIRTLLNRIQQQGCTRMAVITGRPAAEIAPMLALDEPIEVWGLHGAERISTDGRHELEAAGPGAQQKLDQLREMLRRDSFGGLFEDKPNAAVMHWRGASAQRAHTIEKRTREIFEPLAEMDGLSLLEFEAGLELRVGRDKGGAVEAILEESSLGAPIAYLGDDLTDEPAFRAVNASDRASISVLMRHSWRPTDADLWLKPPADLKIFLEKWLAVARVDFP